MFGLVSSLHKVKYLLTMFNPPKKIGLGTAAIGRPHYINVRHEKPIENQTLPDFKRNAIKMLDEAYNNGIRFFDASPGYGVIESVLIEWLQQNKDEDIVIATKWGLSYHANFNINASIHELKEHSLKNLNAQWQFSKKLLPNLKIYQIHSATFDTGVLDNKAILMRLHELKKEYNIIIGLTTTGEFQVEVLKKAFDIEIENEPLFNSFQCTFNIFDQSITQLRSTFQDDNRQLIIKESLANGRLIPNSFFKKHNNLYSYISDLGVKYNVGADAVAMRFCMDSFPKSICLSGASSSNQMRSNLFANQIKLQAEDLEILGSYNVNPEMYWNERKTLPWQ